MTERDIAPGATGAPANTVRAADSRQIGLIRRRRGMAHDAFSHHWRHVHGPLGLKALTNARRYVQNHAVPGAALPDGLAPAPYDGMAEVWFDTPAQAAAVADNEAYRQTVKPDEANFLDANADDLIGRGTVAGRAEVSRSEPLAKLVVLVHRSLRLDDGEFRRAFAALDATGSAARRVDQVEADPEVYRTRRPSFDAILGLWAPDAGELLALWAAGTPLRRAVEEITDARRLGFVANPVRMLWP